MTLKALKYPSYKENPKEKETCPIKYKYRDRVVALSNCKFEPKTFKGYVVGYWYDARNVENFYAVRIVGKDKDSRPYPVSIFPESKLSLYEKKKKRR